VRVLVTGGAGFIGSHLASELLLRGEDVRILDNFATGRRSNLSAIGSGAEVVEGDIQSYERVSRAVKDCDVVLHQAALPSVPRSIQDPLTSNATNVIGTLNLLLASRDSGVRRAVLASSSSVYGSNPELPKREDAPTVPISPYATANLTAENYARSFHAVYGLETVALRYFNVFGALQDTSSQYAALEPRFIASLRPAVSRRSSETASSRAISPTSRTWFKPACWRSMPGPLRVAPTTSPVASRYRLNAWSTRSAHCSVVKSNPCTPRPEPARSVTRSLT
jgi:nucleoside-diphosphate-sugar epimerase